MTQEIDLESVLRAYFTADPTKPVELTMWTANESLVNMARARAPELNEQLQQTGLQMRAFQVVHGQRHAPAHPVASNASGLVVDVLA